jgi:hypothetical protein
MEISYMNSSLDLEIRDKLGSYLLGEISLEDFKDWFVPSSWDVDHQNNQAAINMVYEIELRLAEYSNGYWSEDELKPLLRPLVADYLKIGYDSIIVMDSVARVESYPLWSASFDI